MTYYLGKVTDNYLHNAHCALRISAVFVCSTFNAFNFTFRSVVEELASDIFLLAALILSVVISYINLYYLRNLYRVAT